jgi:hypothetical protein
MAVCTATDLPLAWGVRTASEHDSINALALIDVTRARGFAVETGRDGQGLRLWTDLRRVRSARLSLDHPAP